MAVKQRKLEEIVSLSVSAPLTVSYADYFARKPLFSSLIVKNEGDVTLEDILLTVTSENGLTLAQEKTVEVPFESAVEVELGCILSPVYFVKAEEIREEKICVELKKEKKTIATAEVTVRALPFDFWEGMHGNAETLASFVRPKLSDCSRLQREIYAQLKKWEVSGEVDGYEGSNKNFVRRTAAALYTCLHRYAFERTDADITMPVLAGAGVRLLSEKRASELELALLAAGTLERMGLHSVIALGEKKIACGVWLYDSCFLDTVSDDTARLGEYISDGINNLSFFEIGDLYAGRNAAYATSEAHFARALAAEEYEKFVDIRRCRIARILSLPLKEKSGQGVELLKETDFALDDAPEDLRERKSLKLDIKQTKNKQWERRLLDLSLKNTLLNFQPEKTVAHIVSAAADDTFEKLHDKGEFSVLSGSKEFLSLAERKVFFGANVECKNYSELIALENEAGLLRTFSTDVVLSETLTRLQRKNKEADEETGTKILYLAFGFLRWYAKEDDVEKYAPLVLQPVTLKKGRGGVGFTLVALDDELSVNATLLEYLKQEYDVDIRGLDGALHGLKISEILAMVRMEIATLKNWKVFDDVYLSAFSFARYHMWQDIRKNIGEFSKNPLISSLLNNRNELKETLEEGLNEDDSKVTQTLLPLTADASQWEAIALSQTGKTFVLHGPPGTGKSQTITNMIANALNDNKRVLFVAEKQAALSVVKKRLDGIGLGDFCLELHSGKTSKAEVLQKLTNTLSLAGSVEKPSCSAQAEKITGLKADLRAPMEALHKKCQLGVSVYEALLAVLANRNTPEIMNIESTFYDGLTKEKIEEYERLMVQAATAAKECGGVHNSPFKGVNLTEYSPQLRRAVYCSSEVVVTEIKNLKNYLALFLELYRQRMSTLTRTKLDAVYAVARLLESGVCSEYFRESEEEFIAFFNANRRLDICLEKYAKFFKKPIDIKREYTALVAFLDSGEKDYTKDKTARTVAKSLSRVAYQSMDEEQMLAALRLICDAYEAMEIVRTNTKLSRKFTVAGKVDFYRKRREYLAELYELHDECAGVFMEYNPDSFNSMCIHAANGYTSPVLKGLMRSIESFRSAEKSFLDVIKAEKEFVPEEDVLEFYTLKAGALIDNIDMLASWCAYKKTAAELNTAGLKFITTALENGDVTSENIVGSFEKNVYKNFLQTNLPLDPVLSRFSAAVQEEETESFRLALDEFSKLTKESIRCNLISRLPSVSTEGSLSLELVNFQRLAKTNLRGMGLRKLFEEIPELIKVVAPCMLMSPMTVSQYLQAESGAFDLVIFDEASQMPTAEAVPSLARAKAAVVVGDPKQLPPTGFFTAQYIDEENLENEDMESVLDDCLALGIPERKLTWHYRSKHESLIAFSNLTYYGNKLCTFPSPDALTSKVNFTFVENGVYDRGFTKRNKAEADALVAEVLARLSDPKRCKSSMGVVTFSSVQKDYIERKLTEAIVARRLEEVAYEREEPLFVKNLENVQGDERDVILFSVCYGPDKSGKISLNFGPLNQAGGWRRLNVAVSRAREEMLVFSSMTGAMIDASKTSSKGVLGLKAFLEFAQKGRTTLAIPSGSLSQKKAGLGKYIAKELSAYGFDCRSDVGVSDFKIDVAVVDPKNKHKFILAILCDSDPTQTVKDRNVLQLQTLKRNNWNVLRVFAVNYYNNPKREIKKIKDMLDKLTGADKRGGTGLNRGKKAYKYANLPTEREESSVFVTSGEHDAEICATLKAIVAAEEPISESFLVRRSLSAFGIAKYGSKVSARMSALVALCAFKSERIFGEEFYRKTDKCVGFDRYRVEGNAPLRKTETDFTPYEVIAIVKGALEDKVALYMEEIVVIVASVFKIARPSEKFALYVNDCVSFGEEQGLFVRSVSDRVTMA